MVLKYKVLIFQSAENDLISILDNIAEISGSVRSVEKWHSKIMRTIVSLGYMPERYVKFDFDPRYRLAKVGKYAVFYRVDKEKMRVLVLRIIYARKNLKEALEE